MSFLNIRSHRFLWSGIQDSKYRLGWLAVVWTLGLPCGVADAHIQKLKNANLQPQLEADSNRVMPSNKYISYGVDGQLFSRTFNGAAGYYHGVIWIDNFFEIRPTEKLFLNSRILLYNPAASYGATASNFLHHFTNVRWEDSLRSYGESMPDIRYTGRFMDLGRQTLGAGLTLQEKEMNGIQATIHYGIWDFKFLFDGTGGFNFFGDLYYVETYFWDGIIGVHTFTTQGWGRTHSDRFYGLFNRRKFFDSLTTLAEVNWRNRSWAFLAGIQYEKLLWDRKVKFKGRYEFRYYQNGFGKNIERNINHDYLSIEQEDIAYTNAMNIFVFDDHAQIHSVVLEGSWMPLWWLHLYSNHEIAHFGFMDRAAVNTYFTKNGLGFCPYRGREDCGYVIVANKATSAVAPIEIADFDNTKTMFIKKFYLGLEALFRF